MARKRVWRKIADDRVRHRWDLACACGRKGGTQVGDAVSLPEQTVYVFPSFSEDSGIPICENCGQDRRYVRTEVLR